MLGVKLHEIAVRGMDTKLGGGQREDEPTVAGIDGTKSQNVPKKGPIRFRVLTVEENMSAGNHATNIILITTKAQRRLVGGIRG